MKQVLYWELDLAKKLEKPEYPTTNKEKKKVFIRRYIQIETFEYDRGFGITVKVIDIFDYVDGYDIYIPNIHREVKCWDIYDRDLPEKRELMAALASGDLRGRFAINTAYHLFFTYFQTKLEEIIPYIPEWVEMLAKNKKEYPNGPI